MSDFNVNDEFERTFILSGTIYKGFINIFKDRNPLHTDEKFAIGHGFKGRVMHGNILNGFLSYFIGECLPDKNVIIHSQQIQFKNAIYLNDELVFNAKLTAIYESVGAIEFEFTFKNKESKIVSKGLIQIGLLI
jgi:3-hydroxybutyryl-CoA dehydratase